MSKYLLAVGVVAFLSTSAMATLFVSDNFDSYTQGDLVGQGGWVAHSGGTSNPVQVIPSTIGTGNAIKLVQALPSAQDVSVPLGPTMATGDKWYASFLVSVDGTVSGSDYFAHFKNKDTSFPGKIGVTPLAGSDYTFYVWQGGGTGPTGSGSGAVWATGFTYGSAHQIVTSYEFDTGKVQMWIDPVAALGETGNTKVEATYTSSSTKAVPVLAYAFRQALIKDGAGAAIPMGTQQVDGLLVGTSFAEVVPEPATLALLALGGLVALRRRGV